jgi:hypothetical protein
LGPQLKYIVFKSMSRELLTMFKATKLGNEQMGS